MSTYRLVTTSASGLRRERRLTGLADARYLAEVVEMADGRAELYECRPDGTERRIYPNMTPERSKA